MTIINEQKLTAKEMYKWLCNQNAADGCDIILDTPFRLTKHEWLYYLYNTYRDHINNLNELNEDTQECISVVTNTKLLIYKDFQEYLQMLESESITEKQLESLYETCVTITLADRTIEIPFDAVIYNEVLNLIDKVIKEF